MLDRTEGIKYTEWDVDGCYLIICADIVTDDGRDETFEEKYPNTYMEKMTVAEFTAEVLRDIWSFADRSDRDYREREPEEPEFTYD